MKINKDLTAAAAVPLVLMILKSGESYGYQLIKTVNELSENKWEWSEGMLYPILHRLEKQGWTESFHKASPTGRKRKYYGITESGIEALNEIEQQLNLVKKVLGKAAKTGDKKNGK